MGGQGVARWQVFTNDREKLGAALGHDVSHLSARKFLALRGEWLRLGRDKRKPQRPVEVRPLGSGLL